MALRPTVRAAAASYDSVPDEGRDVSSAATDRAVSRTATVGDLDIELGGAELLADREVSEAQEAQEKHMSTRWKILRCLFGVRFLEMLWGKRYYLTTEQLYRERSELEAIKHVMVDGSSQSVARMLQRLDRQLQRCSDASSEAESGLITSPFLMQWLTAKIIRAKNEIPFVFDSDHQDINYRHMLPNSGTGYVIKQMADESSSHDQSHRHELGSAQLSNCDWFNIENEIHTKLFTFADKDGDDSLSREELKRLLRDTVHVPDSKIEFVISKADINNDGMVSRTEFQPLAEALIEYMKRVEADSLERVQPIDMAERALIDRHGRCSSLALIKMNAEISEIDCIVDLRKTVAAKWLAVVFSAMYFLCQYVLSRMDMDDGSL